MTLYSGLQSFHRMKKTFELHTDFLKTGVFFFIIRNQQHTLRNPYAEKNYLESASSMDLAATFPAPIAEMTVAAPVTASPPA